MDRKLSKDVRLILKNRMQKNKGKRGHYGIKHDSLGNCTGDEKESLVSRYQPPVPWGVILPDGAVAEIAI